MSIPNSYNPLGNYGVRITFTQYPEEGNFTQAVSSGGVYEKLFEKLPIYTYNSSKWDTAPTENSTKPVTSGGVYTALRELPAPVPEPLAEDTVMKNGHVYTVDAAGTALDYSAVTLGDNATAEVWVECTAATNITWPTAWKWLDNDGAAPEIKCDTATEASRRYRITVRNEGTALNTVARVAYDYSNPLPTE